MKLIATSLAIESGPASRLLTGMVAPIAVAILFALCIARPADATLPAPKVTHIYSFSAFNSDGVTNVDGAHVWAPLVYDATESLLYGVAADGGADGSGTLFSIDSSGNLVVRHTFSALNPSTGANSDGAHPYAPLSIGSSGLIYGTTNAGGAAGSGSVFSYAPATGTFSTIYSFSARNSKQENLDGAVPNGGVIQASDGNLYGTASFGGRFATGTVYEIAGGSFKTLYAFGVNPPDGTGNRFAGAPFAQLVEYPKGTLWGCASIGGVTDHGYLFTITISTDTYAVAHEFTGSTSYFNPDGADPMGVVPVPGNVLIGTAAYGGTGGDGNVYQMAPNGTYTKWHEEEPLTLQGTNVQGAFPSAPITDTKGSIYFTVCAGGSEAHGGVVKLTNAGVFRFFADTYPTEGSEPHAALALTPDNKLWGSTTNGGANGTGSIFVCPTTVD